MAKKDMYTMAEDATKSFFPSQAVDPEETSAKTDVPPEPPADVSPVSPVDVSPEPPAKKGFSFRGPEDAVKIWRIYAVAAEMTVDDLGTQALNEYLANHPLEADQKLIFDLKCKKL